MDIFPRNVFLFNTLHLYVGVDVYTLRIRQIVMIKSNNGDIGTVSVYCERMADPIPIIEYYLKLSSTNEFNLFKCEGSRQLRVRIPEKRKTMSDYVINSCCCT